MTFDEAALLLDLEDVYWTPRGPAQRPAQPRRSPRCSAATILALRMLRRGERESEQAGLIPDETGEYKAPGLA